MYVCGIDGKDDWIAQVWNPEDVPRLKGVIRKLYDRTGTRSVDVRVRRARKPSKKWRQSWDWQKGRWFGPVVVYRKEDGAFEWPWIA